MESVNAIKQLERSSILDPIWAESLVARVLLLPFRRFEHRLLLGRCWELRHNLSIYDASYVALAEMLGAPLLTADRSLAEAPGVSCEIELMTQ